MDTRCLFLICYFRKISLFIVYLCLHNVGNVAATPCRSQYGLMSDLKGIACVTSDLRTAVQKDNLLRKMSDINFFSSMSPADIVRSVETLSFFNRSLTDKIKETHESYQESGVDSYTLSITSYPSDVKKGSCSRHKTIDFNPDISNVSFPNYSVVPGKEPRSFQVGTYKGKSVICERTKVPYKQRVKAFCGKPPDKLSEHNSEYGKCKRNVPISCFSRTVNEINEGRCISLETFANLSGNLLLFNRALERKYCPAGCSYYTQTVQSVYKKQGGSGDYCSDSYLIVHCGPKKDASSYNLNIREVNSLCSDSVTCLSANQ